MRSTTSEQVTLEQVRQWCELAARASWEKGGEDTVILSVGETLSITDAFVITSGANPRMIRTMAEEVEEKIKAAGGPAPRSVEGLDDARWVLMDYGDFVVHLLLAEARDFYQLDRLWSDAERWTWEVPEARAAGE
ncbi:MAG: ribosome silencing factor [Acidimicrobiales bacterium]|nr:ribosome silencing factor [Acidimicrobiales bacterium]